MLADYPEAGLREKSRREWKGLQETRILHGLQHRGGQG